MATKKKAAVKKPAAKKKGANPKTAKKFAGTMTGNDADAIDSAVQAWERSESVPCAANESAE